MRGLPIGQGTRVIFFGTPEFALPTLEALWSLQPKIFLVGVVTGPDKPVGRAQKLAPSPVKLWADQHGLPALQPVRLADRAFQAALAALAANLGVIASFGKIIPKGVLDLFPLGVLNVHPSLLPRWRGPSPIQAAIAAGDKETGVTIMLTDEKMDHGSILAQERLALTDEETAASVRPLLAKRGASLLKTTLVPWISGEIRATPQDESAATFSRMLTRASGHIEWSSGVDEIARLVRAYDSWPGTFVFLPDGFRLKILSARAAVGSPPTASVGAITEDSQGFPLIRAGDGALLLQRVQPEGKAPMEGNAFLRGHRDLIGQQLR
ncbi:MAG: methionyl-tRNA formyltransferase [Candidatus Terrybacteria bacterium]|nr:methionyl-tRNA formyltransferase [Candidatus Terrybacteria bacterium]